MDSLNNGLAIILLALTVLTGCQKSTGRKNDSPAPECGSPHAVADGIEYICDGVPITVGKQGAAGKDGRNGAPGGAGPKGDKGDGGGEQGPPGKPGLDGKDGAQGQDGKDGAPGAKGDRGSDGANGRNGVDGKAGEKGVPGDPGKDGRAGRDGKDGISGRIVTSVNECRASWPESTGNIDTIYTIFTYSDDTRESTLRLGGVLPNEKSSNVFIGTSIFQKSSGDYEIMTVDVHEFTVSLQASGNAYMVYRPNGRSIFFACRVN